MARIVFPEDFNSQLTLLANVVAQNGLITKNNPITAYLAQQNIVLGMM